MVPYYDIFDSIKSGYNIEIAQLAIND
jgi:hypothetical protein